MRRITALVLSIAVAPVPALAQAGGPSWLDLLNPNRIVLGAIQSGILALRTQVDLKYGDLSVDLAAGRVTMTDVRIWPLPDWDTADECEITADRLTLRTAALDDTDRLRLKLQAIGAELPSACLPEEPRGALAMAGLDAVRLPRLTADLEYRVSSSSARLHAFGDVADVAAVDLSANFTYVWIDGRDDMDDPEPVVYLQDATLSVENMGLWETLRGQMPPPLTDPNQAPQMIRGMLGEGLADMNMGADGLSGAQQAFLDSVVAAWPAFLERPARLVLETGIDGDVYLDFPAIEDDPRVLFEAVRPRLVLAPARSDAMIPAALLSQAIGSDAGALSPDDRRRVGIALVTGDGAPRNREAGFGLLNAMARDGDGEASLAMSAALENQAPDDAYRWALVAGQAGAAGATARLDRLEAAMPFSRVLELQHDVSGNASHDTDALSSVAATRAKAAARISGQGLARSYQHAAMWAMLAAAAGDPEAADILAEIDERVRLAGPEGAKAWAAREDAASKLATEAWIGQNLPERFGN